MTGEDELDLPSPEPLWNHEPTRVPSKSHITLGHKSPVESTLKGHGWVEVLSPGGTLTLQEL